MLLRTGFELVYDFPQPTPLILVVNIHESRAGDIVVPDALVTDPWMPVTSYRDAFGNQSKRGRAPAGRLRLSTNCVIRDHGQPDQQMFAALQGPVEDLPEDVLVFLLGSRARPTGSPTPPGSCSARWRQATRACRPSAITSTTRWRSTT